MYIVINEWWNCDDKLPLYGDQIYWIGVVSAEDENIHRFVDSDVLRGHHHHRSVCIWINQLLFELTLIFIIFF